MQGRVLLKAAHVQFDILQSRVLKAAHAQFEGLLIELVLTADAQCQEERMRLESQDLMRQVQEEQRRNAEIKQVRNAIIPHFYLLLRYCFKG
jgi:hypothetical protein